MYSKAAVSPIATARIGSRPGAVSKIFTIGCFDILDDLLIRGAGRGSTVVDAAKIDRVFHIPTSSVMGQLMDLEITNGAAVSLGSHFGGGVDSAGRLDLIRCLVSNNRANHSGGILSRRRLNMDDCVVRDNEALDLGFTSSKAGGLAGGSTSLGTGPDTIALILNSSIVNNIAPTAGGLELCNAAWTTIEDTTISGHSSGQVLIRSTDTFLRNVTIKSDLGAGLLASSFDNAVPLEFVNTAIEGIPACSLNTTAPMTWLYSGQNASNDTSCGFTAPGDVAGVPLGLAPLVEAGHLLPPARAGESADRFRGQLRKRNPRPAGWQPTHRR